MAAVDELKKARESDYNSQGPKDPDQRVTMSRIIMLSDDEMKAFEGSQPGQELECLARGNLEEDGHFHVMSVSPPGGQSSYQGQGQGGMNEGQMAQQVAQMVRPQLQPAPS